MKRINFDKLKSISTPDEWLENAVNIPNMKKDPPLPFYRRTSYLTSAACIVLCTVVGLFIIFKTIPDKSVPSNNNGNSTDSHQSAVQSEMLYDSSDHNTNSQDVSSTTQSVTEPSEKTGKKTDTDIPDVSQKATDNSILGNSLPNSGGTQQSTSYKSDFSVSVTVKPTQNNTPSVISTSKPVQSVTQPTASDGVYTNSVYLHMNNTDLNFDLSNTVGCHIKDSDGKELYSYNSEYEECLFETGGDEFQTVDDVCIEYKNKGPNQIKFGIYEVTFYDVNGNTISKNVSFSDNNSVHIFC